MRPTQRMYRAFFVFAAFFASAITLSGQTVDRTLSGIVIRSDSRAPIDGATVTGNGKTATTDKDGRFTLRLPPVRAEITVSATKFFPLTTTVDLTERDVTDSQFALAPDTGFASNVDVVATAPASSPSATPVAPRDVLKTAGALDNVFRTLQTLPGVAATQEYSSRLTVRGGAPDQNLTVMDGVEVHDPFRLFGLASAFNPEIIQRFELATSGFSAKYGDRLSSLLVIENRDGDKSRRLGGSGSLSITDANAVFEGKLPGGVPGSWLVTGRRTYYDLIAGRITDQKFPKFSDLQAKAVWEPSTGRKLTLFGLRSRQAAALEFDDQKDDGKTDAEKASGDQFGRFDDNTRNDLAWARFDATAGARGHSMTVAGYSRTLSNFGVTARFENNARRSNSPSNQIAFGMANVVFSQKLLVEDRSARQEFAWSLGKHTVETGAELHHLTTSLKFVIDGDRNPAAADGSSVQGGAGLPDLLASRRVSTRTGAWLTDSWRVGRATIDAGARVDHASINSETTWSPRLTVSYDVSSSLRARASAGRYTQSPGYEKSAQSDYVLDLTTENARTLVSQRADLASLSIEQSIGRGFLLKAETYYKRLDRVLIGRLETDAERFARIAQYDFPVSLRGEIPTSPLITTTPTNDGRGRAYGVELVASRMTAPTNAPLRGWISYTWGKAERDAYGRSYPFEYDRRSAVSAVLSYRLSRKWEFAATSRWANGFPRTAPVGLRVAGQETPASTIQPARDTLGLLMYEPDLGGIANLNNARLPDFARTDMRMTWKPRGVSGRWEFYVEVLNTFGRDNVGSISPFLAYNPGADRPRIVEESDGSIPRLPTLGIRWKF